MALVGPTASGKSATAMTAARLTGCLEIVSIDSMAVYREMDLGTAKPSREDRAEVPHHLLDVLDPADECAVSLFQQLAREAIEQIRDRGKVPLLVGGTGLYHRAVIDNLEIPGQFPEIRADLEALADEPDGVAVLHARLSELDPLAITKIEPGNARRLVRALEVTLGSGRPFSSFGPGLETYSDSSVLQIGLETARSLEAERIEERVHSWMAAGFLEEVTALSRRPGGLSRTARQAIGYRELLAVVEEGADLNEAVTATISRTRVFARRQRSWFRRDPRVVWEASITDAINHVVDAVERIKVHLEVGD